MRQKRSLISSHKSDVRASGPCGRRAARYEASAVSTPDGRKPLISALAATPARQPRAPYAPPHMCEESASSQTPPVRAFTAR